MNIQFIVTVTGCCSDALREPYHLSSYQDAAQPTQQEDYQLPVWSSHPDTKVNRPER